MHWWLWLPLLTWHLTAGVVACQCISHWYDLAASINHCSWIHALHMPPHMPCHVVTEMQAAVVSATLFGTEACSYRIEISAVMYCMRHAVTALNYFCDPQFPSYLP